MRPDHTVGVAAGATEAAEAYPAGVRASEVREMFERIAGVYDVMNTAMTAGLHHRWRARAAELARVGPGDRVLDVASGTGDLAFELARRVGRLWLAIGLNCLGLSCLGLSRLGLFCLGPGCLGCLGLGALGSTGCRGGAAALRCRRGHLAR